MKEVTLSTKPVIIKNDEINEVIFNLIFPVEYQEGDNFKVNILDYIINTVSKKFPYPEDYHNERLSKKILNSSLSLEIFNKRANIIFHFSIPKENLINNYNFEDALSFAIDTLLNSLVEDNKFNEKKFYYEKDYFVERFISRKTNEKDYYYDILQHIIDPQKIIELYYDDYKKLLEDITPESLYEYYQKNILNNKCAIYVYGDVDKDKIISFLNKYLPQKVQSLKYNFEEFKYLPVSKYKYQEVKSRYKDSCLFMEFQTNELNLINYRYIRLMCYFLGSDENNLVFKKLRTENNLVYSCQVDGYCKNGLFIVSAFLNPKNKDKAIDLVKEIIVSLKDKEVISKCLDQLIKNLSIDLLYNEDNLYFKLNEKINKDLSKEQEKDFIEWIKKVNKDDLIKFIDKIVLSNVVLIRGDIDDKK